MKYKLINTTTKEEHVCDKITIDGFDYYVSDEPIQDGWKGTAYKKDVKGQIFNHFYTTNEWYNDAKKIIATTNPSINVPQVVDEVEELADDIISLRIGSSVLKDGFVEGYNKAKETHPFSEDDMIEFAEWIADSKLHGCSKQLYEAMIRHKVSTTKELLQLWKKQKLTTLYYE